MKKSYELTDPDLLESLGLFAEELLDLGYSSGTILDYVRNAGKYLATGRPVTEEAIAEYVKEQLELIGPDQKKRKRIHNIKSSILRYYEIIVNGDGYYSADRPRPNRLGARKVCDEDCFNCKYPDCIFT